MDRPGEWNFLRSLPPVKHMLAQTEEVWRAKLLAASKREAALELDVTTLRQDLSALDSCLVESERRTAEEARRADELERLVASLREDNRRLEGKNVELTRRNDTLRQRAVAQDAQRWAAILRTEYVPVRPRSDRPDAGAECDVFACLECRSVLVLETPATDEPRWRRLYGKDCSTCKDLPCSRPPGQSVAEPSAVVEADLRVQGERQERENIAAELVAGLLKDSLVKVAADAYAKKAVELTCKMLKEISPEESSSLDALACGLSTIPDTLRKGIVWCATELFGMSDFLGKVLGHVVAQVVTGPVPLKEVALILRVADTAGCALNGDLSRCASLRHLVFRELTQAELAEYLQESLSGAIALHGPAEPANAVEEPEPPEIERRGPRGPRGF